MRQFWEDTREYWTGFGSVVLAATLGALVMITSGCGEADDTQITSDEPVAEADEPGFADFGLKDEAGTLLQEHEFVEPQGDLGQSEQPLIFAPSGTFNPGVKPSSFSACFQGDNNQNCVVPRLKDVVFWFASGSASKQSIYAGLIFDARDKLLAQGLEQCTTNGCWHFRQATSENDPELTLRIVLNESPEISACAGSADQVKSKVCLDGQTTSLQKQGNGLWGFFHRFQGAATAAIDEGEIAFAPLLTTNQKTARRKQMVGTLVLWMMGQGSVQVGQNYCINPTWVTLGQTCVYSPSQACRGNGYGGEEDQDHIVLLGNDCGTFP